MATSQQFLVCDFSTLANFKSVGSAISGFFATAGWTQSTDTGQVNWSTIGAVAAVYEIWRFGDALTPYYFKIAYANSAMPSISVTIGTGTNGSGTLTGTTLGPLTIMSALNPVSSTATYECNFSGSASRIGFQLWRNAPSGAEFQTFIGIERSLSSSGTYTSDHCTLVYSGWQSSNKSRQRTLVAGIGASNDDSGICAILSGTATTSSLFNTKVPISPIFPNVGAYDYPLTVAAFGRATDFIDGGLISSTLYGSTITYIGAKTDNFISFGPAGNNGVLLMRYD
jgi:hypothetical protein